MALFNGLAPNWGSYPFSAIKSFAAGDIFNGALTVALSEGKDWYEAIEFANKAAGIGVSRLGAQVSVPFRKELKI